MFDKLFSFCLNNQEYFNLQFWNNGIETQKI